MVEVVEACFERMREFEREQEEVDELAVRDFIWFKSIVLFEEVELTDREEVGLGLDFGLVSWTVLDNGIEVTRSSSFDISVSHWLEKAGFVSASMVSLGTPESSNGPADEMEDDSVDGEQEEVGEEETSEREGVFLS